jgi:acyl-CoA thioesterase-1
MTRRLLIVSLVLLAASCAPAPPAPAPAARAAEAPEAAEVVVILGDSLAAGFGLPAAEAFPALVEARLRAEGRQLRVVNAGVSGDTTAGGLRRLDWVLKANGPDLVVVELGGNDGLRGLSLEETESNLRSLIERSKDSGAQVLLAGMLIPPNYGPDYANGFAAMFPRVAAETGATLLPFLLEGVAADPALNLPDGLHPNAAGHERVAETLVNALRPLLAPAKSSREAAPAR